MSRREQQAGFSIVIVLAVVAVFAILGTGGWIVYQHNRVKVTDAAANSTSSTVQKTTTTQSAQTTSTANESVINIPELGIQITVPNDIKDVSYKIGTATLNDGRKETFASFTTKALSAIDAGCDEKFGPLGTLAKIDGQYPASFSDSNPAMAYGVLIKQYSGSFLSSFSPQAACSHNSSALSSSSKFKSEFQASYSSIQQLSTSTTN